MDFVVRNIPATASLDGAFRVHLAPECMQQAGLTFNEPCEILDEHDRVVGCGIAWRAADKMGAAPKTKPVRMSEVLRDAFGIKEGSHVKLQAGPKANIRHAERVILTDVSASSDHPPETGGDDRKWRGRCASALYNAEAIASGVTFDVTAKKGFKRRFHAEINDSAKVGATGLFFVDDDTEVVLSDTASSPNTPTVPALTGQNHVALSTEGIGGLIGQIEALNTSMRLVLQQSQFDGNKPPPIRQNWPIILHGYEGTGKSLLLNRAAQCGFRKTLHLHSTTLDTGTTPKNKALIVDVFEEARAYQPSLLLMDDVHKLAPADDGPYREAICAELDKVIGSNVLVVGATRSLQDVHSALIGAGRFTKRIELPIPDLQARERILHATLKTTTPPDDAESVQSQVFSIASRTHGFTCRDLVSLIDLARMHAVERSEANSSANTNGSNADASLAAEGNAQPFIHALPHPCEAQDWDFALSQIRPAALREIFFETPKIKWSDIGGSQPIQAQLDEIIGWPLHHPRLMKQYNLPAQKGMLLYGPPGCSKTLTAQAVAANYDMNFIAVKGAELISMYVGESERSVREIFRKARTAKPCIVFFDEIDSIASERDSAGTKGLNVLTTLLNEMDGFESLEGVFVLAATNKPEVLDPAIMRPGRFDQHLYLPPPSEAARGEILELHLSSAAREDDLDTGKVVKATAGYTGAEVVAVCNLAKKCAVRRLVAGEGGGTIRMDDVEKALAEIPPRITRDMLEAYEAFAKR